MKSSNPIDRVAELRAVIDRALPPGSVIPQHTSEGHFYRVTDNGAVYPSVTGRLKAIKDESIQNFSMNEALRYIEANLSKVITPHGTVNIPLAMDMFAEAKKASSGVLSDAGDIGTQIHDRREKYFQAWIDSGERPDMRGMFKSDDDPRLIAGMLGLEKFVDDYQYIPLRTELMVYSHKLKSAGMLDDVGLARFPGSEEHEFVLMDLKTSNQFKAHYWLQVALYYEMFRELVGLSPERSFILKLSKEMPEYRVEELKNMRRLVAGVKNVLKVDTLMLFIKDSRNKKKKAKVII